MPKLLQRDDYYPFGLKFNSTVNGPENNFTYNGKELEDEFGLNWYHYGWRFYDPQLSRWHAVDPVDEYNTPFAYVGNDPINLIDKDGKASCCLDQSAKYLAIQKYGVSKGYDPVEFTNMYHSAQAENTLTFSIWAAGAYSSPVISTLQVGYEFSSSYYGLSENTSYTGAVGRATTSKLTYNFLSRFNNKTGLIGGASEIAAGFVDRAISGESLVTSDIIVDGFGGSVGASISNNFLFPNLSESARRISTSSLQILSTNMSETVFGGFLEGDSGNLFEAGNSVIVPQDNTRVYQSYNYE